MSMKASIQQAKEAEKLKRESFQKTVGQRVKQLREEKKWTQEKLAQEAQINDKYVYDIEVGNKCMSIWVLKKIASALGIESAFLLADETEI